MAQYSWEQYVAKNKGKGFYLLSKRAYYEKYGGMGTYKGKRKRANGNGPPRKKPFRKGYDRTVGLYQTPGSSAGELKWFDLTFSDSTLGGTVFIPTLGSWNIIDQGVGESQRIGRKCVIKKIQIRWDAALNPQASGVGGNSNQMRVILYLDKQANGAIATIGTILQTTDIRSFRNMENIGRYQILMDKLVTFNVLSIAGNGTANDTSEVMRRGTYYKDCNIPIEFSGATGGIGEIRSNNLGMVVVSSPTEDVSINVTCRLRFVG